MEKHDLSGEINGDLGKKKDHLLKIVGPRNAKTLVYAGTYTELNRISKILTDELAPIERSLPLHFARWLRQNYKQDWQLADLVERGVGVHNGQMHRCLTQIQVKIFEATQGFDSVISTSSIIEGVNTSAENTVLWRNRLGSRPLADFTYKNIIGRGGRMFKYFIGKIYLLEPPPTEEDTQLELELPDQILGGLSDTWESLPLTAQQIEKIRVYRETMTDIVGKETYTRIESDNLLGDPDADFLLELAKNMKDNPHEWRASLN